jgi:two-component system chemotaxis response regulator CheB
MTMSPAKVLICDGSPGEATRLRALLEQDGGLSVVGISPSGEHALESLPRLRPTVIAINLELPGMDAVRAIEEIMRRHPVPILALRDADGRSDRSRAALTAGALKTLPKPPPGLDDRDWRAVELRRQLRQLARGGVARPNFVPPARGERAARDAPAVGVGASTGGPGALRKVLGRLPADYPVPIMVVQHIGAGFLAPLVSWLDGQIALPVGVARHGALIEPGVWLAPDGAHLTVTRSLRIVLDHADTAGLHCPSVDKLLESMAAAFGARSVAVVLTGMGSDGARGVAAITSAGGLALAQDEASSAVFGMPRAAGEQGAQTLPLDEIPDALQQLRPARRRP